MHTETGYRRGRFKCYEQRPIRRDARFIKREGFSMGLVEFFGTEKDTEI
jgi:hypothetical protein